MQVKQVIELPEGEVAFVRAICEGYSPCQAAELAGYTAANATNLMRRPRIVAAILACQSNLAAVVARLERKAERKEAARAGGGP